ncbi:MAG: hypothetical protein NVS3B28_06340 [Candidatus Velthaea sp.]
MLEAIAGLDITPQMAHALHEIPEAGSVTMTELANELSCDASNITGVVDRLEARGLAERRSSSEDRRVKCVVLTAAGKRLRKRLDERFDVAPPAIAALSLADQRALREIFERALAVADEQRSAER